MTFNELCEAIINHPNVKKAVRYGEKRNQNGELREVSFLIVTDSEPKDLESGLYRELDCDIAFNLLVYREDVFSSLVSDPTSYAYSILSKGTVIYG